MLKRVQERGGVMRVFVIILVILGFLATLGAVGYLLSDINHRRYRFMVLHDDKAGVDRLLVQRGLRLPMGFENYVPEAEALREAYAPIEVPQGKSVGDMDREVFDDRTDLTRAMFALLAGWARESSSAENQEVANIATVFVARCELLPGLSEQQRIELKTLRADFAYLNAKRLVQQAQSLLKEAKADFELSQRLKTSRKSDAEAWVKHVNLRIIDLMLNTETDDTIKAPMMATPKPLSESAQELEPEKTDQEDKKWDL